MSKTKVQDYNPTVCYDKLIAQNYGPCPNDLGTGSSYHCTQAQSDNPAVYDYCHVNDIYTPFKYSEAYNATLCAKTEYNPSKCQEKVFQSIDDLADFLSKNPQFKSRPCYCCCSCLAYGTPIGIPTGMKAIQLINVGEEVMGAYMQVADDKISFNWKPSQVTFSQGTPPPADPQGGIFSTMVFIYCSSDVGLIASEDQLLLMPDGTVRQAGSISTKDSLVMVDGSSIPVLDVKIANWYGGVHHITINKEYHGDINGHLINANGFVVGDFTLQLNPKVLGDRFVEAPMIGSEEYDKIHAGERITRGVYSARRNAALLPMLPKYARHFSEVSAYIPDDASMFITRKQAIDIVGNPDAHFRPFGNKSGIDGIQYLFNLYKGFYPDFNFYLDWDDISPNAYAFEAYGMKNVVISGGLVRLAGLYIQGQAFIIAQCIARLIKPSRYDGPFPLPTIQADYYGMGLVMQVAWNFNSGEIGEAAIEQMRQFWGYIAPDDQKGNPKDPQNEPSIDCRIKTINYAQLGGGLPACAQPPMQLLEVTGDELGITVDKKPYVIIAFSQVLNQESAEIPANYAFDPAVEMSLVKLVQTDGMHVQIIADFIKGTSYIVTVTNVKSGTGAPLNPLKNTAQFQGQ